MATFIVNTKNHGPAVFICRDSGGYVRVNGQQIGSSGHMGIMIAADAATLEKVSRKWHKKRMADIAEYGCNY